MSNERVSRFWKDCRGSVVLIYAIALPVLAFAVGFAVDFGRAAQLRTRLNSAADAAALAALTPSMMAQTNAVAQQAAVSMFNGQAGALAGLANGDTTVTVTVTNPNNNALIRNVSVCYNAAEQTIFAGILGATTLALGSCANAHAQVPPNIDFYLLLDNSPSMSLPATQAGITMMQSLTADQENGGCAFACHQASNNTWDPNTGAGDTAGNPCIDGTSPTLNVKGYLYCVDSKGNPIVNGQIDNFQLSRNNGITLRLDELTTAVQTMMATAQTSIATAPYNPPPAFRFAANSMDSLWQIGFTNLMPLTPNFISGWATAKANFGVMEMYSNNNVCAQASCPSSGGVGDVESNYDNAMSSANAQMPNPGNGTNQSGDKPQEVLFVVTDGVEDEESGGIRLIQQINGGTATNYCDQIKARGIKIAILYTEYLPVPVNPFYVNNVEPFQPEIGPALQACASPGLYYDAAIGVDLGVALSQLFQASVQSANLTQ